MNLKDESVGNPPVHFDSSIKHRILLRAAARKNQATDEFLLEGDAEASQLISTLRKISLTPPRVPPKKVKEAPERKDPPPEIQPPEPKVQTPLLRSNTGLNTSKLQSDLSILKETYDRDLDECVHALKDAAQCVSAKQVAEIRDMPQPGPEALSVCEAFLALYAEIDSRIDVTPSFQVLTSCSWEAMQTYAQQPGHVIRMMRRTHELVLGARISDSAVARVKSFLRQSSPSTGSVWQRFFEFVSAAVDLHEAKRDVGSTAAQSYLKSLNTSRTPLSSNQTTMRTMDDTLPTISVSLLSECGFGESFRRNTPSPSCKENSPAVSSFGAHKTRQLSVSQTIKDIQWKMDDLLRDFIRSKTAFDSCLFLRELATSKGEVIAEFTQKATAFTDSLPAALQTHAVQPFLATLAQDSVLEDLVKLLLRLCPGS